MSVRPRTLLIVVAAVVAAGGVLIAANPLRRSEESTRAWLLELTPLGTSMEEVNSVVERKGWELAVVSTEHGFMDEWVHPRAETGAKHIRASLGDYTSFALLLPLPANVSAFWGFDESGRLIDIWVWKTIDGP